MVRALAELDRFLNRNVASLPPGQSVLLRRGREMELPRTLSNTGTWGSGSDGAALLPLKLLLSQALNGQPDTVQGAASNGPARPMTPQGTAWQGMAGFGAVDLDKIGAALCHLDTLCRMASRIRLEDADWRSFRRDILDLTSPELSVAEKLHVIATMRHTYHVFDLRL